MLNDPSSQVDSRPYNGDNARVLGLCTGALAAAAISCSESTLGLVPLAILAIKVAFRVGLHAVDAARRIAPDASNPSWSMIVPGVASAEAAVENFCAETVRLLAF